ncbi:MAG: transcriptional regulator, partial [Desulfobacteraceae bacterium]|nr:transcriptional regulator [Desulfobacteraceae bacterium]
MNTPIRFICFTTALLLILFAWVHAGEVTIPNTFESGTPAVAAEVNENF